VIRRGTLQGVFLMHIGSLRMIEGDGADSAGGYGFDQYRYHFHSALLSGFRAI
jgi:hypothetical protein